VTVEQGIELLARDDFIAEQHLPEWRVGPRCRLKSQGGLELRAVMIRSPMRSSPNRRPVGDSSRLISGVVVSDGAPLTHGQGAQFLRARLKGLKAPERVEVAQGISKRR